MTSFHKGEGGKVNCYLAMGDKDKNESEFRATKWELQVLNTFKKTRLLRREEKYHLATRKHSKMQPLIVWQFINTRGIRKGRSRRVLRWGKGENRKVVVAGGQRIKRFSKECARTCDRVMKARWYDRAEQDWEASRTEPLLLAALLWESRALPHEIVPCKPEWHFLQLLSPSCLQVKTAFCFPLAKGGNQDMGKLVGFSWTSWQICFGLMLLLTQGKTNRCKRK